jgi:hypothetical protein
LTSSSARPFGSETGCGPERKRHSMKWIGIWTANIVLFAAVGYFVYWMAFVNQRRVPDSAMERTVGAPKPGPSRSSSAPYEQRRAAASCVQASWPNPVQNCSVGSDATAAHNTEAPQAELASAAVGQPAPASTSLDPSHTSSVSRISSRPVRYRTSVGRSLTRTREVRRAPRLAPQRNAARPTRKIRLAAQPRRYVAYYEIYPRRTAYAPWWSPVQAWGDERGRN